MESLVRLTLFFLLVPLSTAVAQTQTSLEGVGRISLFGGWRYTPNEGFYSRATELGNPPTLRSIGGPMGTATFAYSVTDEFELGLDLFASREIFRLQDLSPVSSTSYGLLVGLRLQREMGPVIPYLGAFIGPTLIYTSNPGAGTQETSATGLGAGAGLNFRISDRFALVADGKFVLARGAVAGIGGVNGGGIWLGVGCTYYFQREPNRGEPGPF